MSIRYSLCLFALLSLPCSAADLGDKLSGLFSEGSGRRADEILDPDRAFKINIAEHTRNQLLLSWQIEPGYYLYKDKLAIRPVDQAVKLEHVALPPGTLKDDLLFGQVEVYYGQGRSLVPFTLSDSDLKIAKFELSYQGCKEDTVCYPPIKKILSLALGSAIDSAIAGTNQVLSPRLSDTMKTGASTASYPETAEPGKPPQSVLEDEKTPASGVSSLPPGSLGGFVEKPVGAEDSASRRGSILNTGLITSDGASNAVLASQEVVTRKLKEGALLLNILAFFGFGFLLAFTPCIFPMVPILSGIIVGEGGRITRARALFLSLSYVLSMALCYAVLGVMTGLFGFNIQAAFQSAWVLVLFSGIFVFLALSMFGFYKLQLPSSWRGRLSSAREHGERGTLKGAAIMGALSAVIVGPCMAPPLAGALLYISQTGNALLGGLSLFSMGLGFGVPLLLAGITAGELLPRAGAWMNTVQRVFGVIMLAVAIWFLERVLPASVTLLLWAALFITTAIFMGALDRLESGASHWRRLWKGIGLVPAVYGVILIVASVGSGGTVTRPFNQPLLSGGNEVTLSFQYIADTEALQMQLAEAKREGRSVMLDFYADWCITCNELERHTFSDPGVGAVLQEVVLLKADVTANNVADRALLQQFDLFGPPAILFFNTDAIEVKSHRLTGFVGPEQFVPHVRQALAL